MKVFRIFSNMYTNIKKLLFSFIAIHFIQLHLLILLILHISVNKLLKTCNK